VIIKTQCAVLQVQEQEENKEEKKTRNGRGVGCATYGRQGGGVTPWWATGFDDDDDDTSAACPHIKWKRRTRLCANAWSRTISIISKRHAIGRTSRLVPDIKHRTTAG
jgi:hypothetical protein